MKKILIVLLLSISGFTYAESDRSDNPRMQKAEQSSYDGNPRMQRAEQSSYDGSPTLDPGTIQYIQSPQDTSTKDNKNGVGVFMEVLWNIETYYYKDIDSYACILKILVGGVSECTDRYSFYLEPAQVKEEKENFTVGELVGIGATLEINKDGGVKVLDVIENSPAEKAGLQANDIIIAISSNNAKSPEDWTALGKMTLDQTVKLIRGPKGTTVNLLVIRNGEKKKFSIIRDAVKIPFLKTKMLCEKIGYIRIAGFGGEVSAQFYDAMQKLDTAGAKSIIIDLRNNGGGKLDSVLAMCSWFAKTAAKYAAILYIKDRNNPLQDIGAGGLGVGKFQNKPVFVLQNGNSASASEIFSGYLQSEAGAVVIGEKSFGKGIVQSLISLSNGGELHLTTSEYFIGKKLIKVHGIGISPTIEIKQSKPIKTEQDDEQLQRAILEAEKLLK